VWYRFRAPTAGTITADTFGSSYDTILSAYTGFCGAMTEVSGACSDNANATTQSQISFTATSGQTYSFMVSAPNFDGGTLVFHLTFS